MNDIRRTVRNKENEKIEKQRKLDEIETKIDFEAQKTAFQGILLNKFYLPNQRKAQDQGRCGSCYAFSSKYLLEDVLRGAVDISV